ncbi:MAG TPA: glycosyl transferase family 1 [Alphaproteobacteria bacterium]|nr:glycosyl transferase family 1 [Alphaproteobacteria bacterium]
MAVMAGGAVKILVLAHDLSDAAIHKRVAMLRAGGADVTVAGFRRAEEPVTDVAGLTPINWGRTYNRGFLRRILSVLWLAISMKTYRALFANTDVILARNLEMLALGVRGRSLCNPKPVLVYECLDIHSLLLRQDFVGTVLRKLEGWLSRRASALVTSSPAFVSDYFNKLSRVRLPIHLVENKVFDLNESAPVPSNISMRPPWVIGWFGILRCKKSLHILADLVRHSAGNLQVIMRGKPALDQLEDFDHVIATTPGMRFLGPYKSPDDLASIYSEVHFTWAIDMYEEGRNSSWLLPNRLYEGGRFGTVPLALADVETGKFLQQLGIGVTTQHPIIPNFGLFFKDLTGDQYQRLRQASSQPPAETWVCGRAACADLVGYLQSLKSGSAAHG